MKNITKKITKNLAYISFVLLIITLINKFIFVLSTLNKKLYEVNSYYYQWKFGKIHYSVSGSGAPILLIHSMDNGASSYEYTKIIKTLSKKRTVYAIDLIGFGKSEKPKITYTAYLYVQLLHDFVKEVIQEDTDIVTSGKSNSFVTMLSMQNSSYLNKLIFINPGDLIKLSRNPTTKHAILKYIFETPLIGTLMYTFVSSKSQIKQHFKKYYFSNFKHVSKKFIDAFYESSHLSEANNKYVYASNLCHYNNVNITSALELINNSIFIIQGNERHDPYENIISDYKRANAAIECSLIYRTKEYPHIERPKAVLEVLSLYLN